MPRTEASLRRSDLEVHGPVVRIRLCERLHGRAEGSDREARPRSEHVIDVAVHEARREERCVDGRGVQPSSGFGQRMRAAVIVVERIAPRDRSAIWGESG